MKPPVRPRPLPGQRPVSGPRALLAGVIVILRLAFYWLQLTNKAEVLYVGPTGDELMLRETQWLSIDESLDISETCGVDASSRNGVVKWHLGQEVFVLHFGSSGIVTDGGIMVKVMAVNTQPWLTHVSFRIKIRRPPVR